MSDRISSLVSQFRNYDQCVETWLQDLPSKDDGDPIPVVMATPDRAFAAVATLLNIKGLAPNKIPYKSIPLPFVSVSSGSIAFDPERYHGPVRINIGTTAGREESYQAPHPLPYNITYRVEYWSKTITALNSFKLWMAASFANGYEQFIPVDLSDYWEGFRRKLIPITNDGLRFVGELEPEDGHRVLREIQEFTLKGWVIPPPIRTKNVHQIIVETYLAKTRADLQSDVETIENSPDLFDKVDTQIVE